MHLLFRRLERIKGWKPVCLSDFILPEPAEAVSVEKVGTVLFMHTDKVGDATKETKQKVYLNFGRRNIST